MGQDKALAVVRAAATVLAALIVAMLALLVLWGCVAIAAGIAHTIGGI